MSLPRRLRASLVPAALLLFIVSFFLPAYGDGNDPANGWACFLFCLKILDREVLQAPGQLYYFGFVATNLLFVVLWFLRLKRATRNRLALAISALLLTHVASWLVLNVYNSDDSIRYGYHVWLIAFLLLFWAEVAAPKTQLA